MHHYLNEFYYKLLGGIHMGRQIDCIFLDYRKAFYTVSHSLLYAQTKPYKN